VTGFTWRDGERLVRFGPGALADAPGLIAGAGLDGYALLTTERAAAVAPELLDGAARVLHVPAGRVDEVSAGLLADVGEADVVAVGGGRVVDTAKAVAGVRGGRVAAIPTTLSGAEMTPFHRTPAGAEGARLVRPSLVVADPELMASQPLPTIAASAMNALAHALEALYTPFANPVCDGAALRAATEIATAVTQDPPGREGLALGAVLAGYASGSAGIAVHHAVCQTIVRTARTPHAETNAVMLPHSARLMAGRAPGALGAFAEALGDPAGDPDAAPGRIAKLAARSGHVRLSTLGVEEEQVAEVAAAVSSHPLLGNTPEPPGADELEALLRGAL
jgi:alcohol dehydrogenase class IV